MAAYLFIFLFPFLAYVARKRRLLLLGLPFLGLLLCTTYYNGSDWRQYEYAFMGATSYYQWEPGFSFLFSTASSADVSFITFLISVKILVYILIIGFIKRYLISTDLMAFALFFSSVAIFLFIDNPLRQFISLPFFVVAFVKMAERRSSWFPIMLVGMLFHFSVAIVAILYILRYFSTLQVTLLSIISVFIIMFSPLLVADILNVISPFKLIQNLDWYLRWYLSDIEPNVGGSTILYGIALLIYLNATRCHDPVPKVLRNSGVLYFVVGIFGSSIPELGRLNTFLWFPMIAALCCSSHGKNLSRHVVALCGIFLFLNFHLIFTDYRYLPYTSYPLILPIEGELPYSERYKYHFDYHSK